MRLILCVKRDLHGAIFLNRLLPRLAGHAVWVLLSSKTRPAENDIPALAELVFLERTLPMDHLLPLVDRSGRNGEWRSIEALTGAHGVPYQTVTSINDEAIVARMRAFAPDLIVSARFSHIFKPEAIGVPRHGVINVHPGELPHFAGLFAPMRSVAEGRRELSCCLHWIDPGIDTGPIIATERLPYRAEQDLLSQIAELYPLAIEPLLTIIGRLERGETVPTQAQDRTQRRYRSMPDTAEIAAFLAAGHRFWHPASYDALLARFMPTAEALRLTMPKHREVGTTIGLQLNDLNCELPS
jgi:methionyl-tRNA formyltransferase